MKAHTTYFIYPKAINDFLDDNYDLQTINFGNIKNNITAILQKLRLDNYLDCEWDISPLYFFDKKNITKENNKPEDFEEYSNFKFVFNLKEGKSSKEYEDAIKKLKSEFIDKYQLPIKLEHDKRKEQLRLKERKKERIAYFLVAILFIVLIISLFILS